VIKNIIFDWTGVIKDSVDDFLVVANKMFAEFGAREIVLDELKDTWEQPYMKFWNRYVPDLTIEDQNVAYKKAMAEAPKGKSFPGMADLVLHCHQSGIKMMVLSSDHRETLLPEIESFGLEGCFIEVITDVHSKKEGINELIAKYELNKGETLFIGDSNHEIEEGNAVGVKTAAATWGFSTRERLEALHPDFVVNTIDELRDVIFANKSME